jgi:hypothetical protein
MKKFISLLSIISILGLASCGGGSSKEAKELLQKILQIVGIPYDIVINVCQDDNNNGICENSELQTKVTVSNEDSFDDILEKISLTEDGRYFLETRDPKKPILLELQDKENVNYNNGGFTLPFSGFKNYEDNETKELSILMSMVDNTSHLSETDIEQIRNLDNKDTQNKFYSVLLSSLEKNINTLVEVGLDIKTAVSADLEEMSINLVQDGIKDKLPQDLNNCGTNMNCVNTRLKQVDKEITITPERAEEIKNGSKEHNNNTNNDSDNKKIFVSKEKIESKTDYGNGIPTITTTNISSYKYDGNKLISSHHEFNSNNNDTLNYTDCIINYNSKGRETGTECINSFDNSKSKQVIIYNGNKVVEEKTYMNGNLFSDLKAIEWNGNKISKIEENYYNDKEKIYSTNIVTIKYSSNDNPIEIITDSNNGVKTKITKEFDNKKSPYYYQLDDFNSFGFFNYYYNFGKNNAIKEISKNYQKNKLQITEIKTNKLKYNNFNMPTRIDSVEKTISSSPNYQTQTTTSIVTTYEYIEVN